jgi:signal transduction histidine kinase
LKTRSLARQTIISILVAEFLCAFIFMGAALLHERRTRLAAFDVMMQGRFDTVFGVVQDAEDVGDNLIIDARDLDLPGEDAYAVYLPNGRVLGSSNAAPADLIKLGKDGFTHRRVNGHTYRVLQRNEVRVIDSLENGGHGIHRPVTILYASPEDRVWHGVLEAVGFYVSVGVVLILGTAVLMIFLMRRVLRPIRELGIEASGVSARSLQFNPPQSAMQMKELRPLATALSSMVDGLNESFQQQHRFVGDAAHELKTAVAVTRSTIQLLLLRPRSTQDYAAGLDELLHDNDRVEELVARMLTLAQLEERNTSTPISADLVEATQKVVQRMRRFAEARNVAVELHPADAAFVPVCTEELEVLISNLLLNAIQHSPQATTVIIEISTAAQTVLLRVRDHGEGISREALPHVFERFYREDRSRSRETGGAGLGLAICKSIVDAAQGSIEIESAPHQGTTVLVTLPAAIFSLS